MVRMRLLILVVGGCLGGIIDARRNYSGGCSRPAQVFYCRCPRPVVNHDGLAGDALDPMVWSLGVYLRGVELYMLFVIGPFFLGLLVFGMGNGALLLRLMLLVMMLSYDHILLVCL